MKFKIPSNTQIEDRILPFLTIRQLIILSVGGVLCYMIFQALFSMGYLPAVWGTIDFIVGGLFVAAAFLKINHLEFHRWIVLLISKAFVPQKRFFNNGLIGGQNFDVLNFTSSNNTSNKKDLKKDNLKIKLEEEKKNDFDKMKNEIFGNNQKNIHDVEDLYDFDKDEKEEFGKRFG